MSTPGPITEAEDISKIAFGFMASKALFVALHLDLFSHLSAAPASSNQLADLTGLPENRILTVLTALLTTGLIEKNGDVFSNSPGAESFLVQGAKYDFGDYLRYQIDRQMFPFMNQLEDVVFDRLADDKVASYADWMADEEEARVYSESQHAGSLGPGKSLARLIDFSTAKHLLDIAGGTGGFAIRLCEANPSLKVTVLDFPNVIALGQEKIEQAGMSDRISFIGANALESEWPQPVDAVLMSYLLSGVPGDAVPDLLKHAFDVLEPGGKLVIHDFMVEDDRMGPELAALWQLQHLAFTPDAVSITPAWLKDIMLQCGFVSPQVATLIKDMTKVVWVSKP